MLILVGAITLVLLSDHASRAAPGIEPIVNGQKAAKNNYPWQVLIKYDDEFVCGGSLIRDDVILTAAHCVEWDVNQRIASFTVIAGEHTVNLNEGTEQERNADTIIMHEDYKDDTLDNDIALIFLDSPFQLDNSVQLVPKLADRKLDRLGRRSNDTWVSGWGVFDDDSRRMPRTLQELKTNILSNQACNRKLARYGFTVTAHMVCTFNKEAGICNGDSGGPMGFYNKRTFVQVGIVSWGPELKCSNGRQVFTRVSRYRGWIEGQL